MFTDRIMKNTLTILFLLTFFKGFAQNNTNEVSDYLNQNKEVVNIENDSEIAIFDADFYKNKLFLFGENHGSSNPHLFDVKLFKQLYYKASLRNYIAEVDLTKAWMLNNYLKDGNEEWLKKVFKSWVEESSQWASKSNYAKFQNLHKFYQELPKNQKFTIIGIDVVQDYSLLKEYVNFLISNKKNLTAELTSFVQMSDTITYAGRRKIGAFSREKLVKMIDYEGISKKNIPQFKSLITSLSYVGAGMMRDSIMYKNLKSQIEIFGLETEKLYGFLGYYHCLQVSYEKSMPFAALLNKHEENFKKNIVSMQMMCIQSKVLLPYIDQVKKMMPQSYADKLRNEDPDFKNSKKYIPYEMSNDNSMMKIDGIEFLKSASEANSTTIFKLNAANSPFTKSKLLGEVTGFQTIRFTDKNTSTFEAFQYIVLFRNSKAGLPIE
jgi:hypothetical protein